MILLIAVCMLICVGAYLLASYVVADGLPLLRDWSFWAGLPVVILIGVVGGWALSLAAR